MSAFFNQLRHVAVAKAKFIDENSLNDEEFQCIAPITKQQFQDLLTYCDPVLQNGRHRYIRRKDLLMFLCKLRQGLSDEFLKVIFDYGSKQNVSTVIDYVRRALAQRFVSENIGPRSITRQDFIARHVTEFSNILYNPQPNEPKAIVVIDSTYAYIHKSSHFRVLRQSYSVHKHRHLLKPTLVVAPDGFILQIFGPYFSDSRNNDAEILRHDFETDGNALKEWFQRNDIVLVDRGYRDAIPLLQLLGIQYEMPALLGAGQRQLTTEDANASRIVTKSRWIVESRNGHFRSVFKFFANTLCLQHAKNLDEFYRIAGAILNRYHPMIHMEGATAQAAQEILERSRIPNAVQARVEVDNLTRRNAQWRRLNHRDIPEFPLLDLEYLRHLTLGVYQINLAPSYIQDKVLRDNDEEFQLDKHLNEAGFLRIRVYSRFRNAGRHQIFILFRVADDEGIENADDADPITGYYCTCQSGARTLGACAHVTSVIWFLGYARHQVDVRYPDPSLLNTTLDAANRDAEGHVPNAEIEIIND
ncbi:uncharacterized protein LOC112462835 [Temnothorax curvispinosus]|uniref:Uncharacterized protein LOC112462835 n=1 Tax=Temnothorax curvispinosus TaxID=300111 RepID=A0A6J1QQB2_9HYME|nr:uncharacterized protein LOC112462835 [Temnothorax curvispinosus]